MTTRRQFMFIAPAAMIMLSACSFEGDTCEEKQKRSIKKIISYISEKMTSLKDSTLDPDAADIKSILSGFSELIGDQEVKTDSEAAAIIVKSIKKDSENNNYVVLGNLTVTRTEGFIYLVKTDKSLSLSDAQISASNVCKTEKK